MLIVTPFSTNVDLSIFYHQYVYQNLVPGLESLNIPKGNRKSHSRPIKISLEALKLWISFQDGNL